MLNILRKVGKTLMYLLASILICLLFILVYLIIVSPGKFKPFKDEDGNILTGSISEKIMVNINGVNQGMFIQSKDLAHPVLLSSYRNTLRGLKITSPWSGGNSVVQESRIMRIFP